MNMVEIAEKVASAYALEFLREYFGGEIFLGSDIEQLLADKAVVIYQEVNDPEYFGAAIHMMDKHIIAINTYQPLRTRYYSAAHELWHLQFESEKIPLANIPNFDHERAADHFAAALMLPEKLLNNLIQKIDNDLEKIVIKIADISSMPYVAVVRRMRELGKRVPKSLSEKNEEDWVELRKNLGISQSPLDKADKFVQFNALTEEVDKQLKEERINLEIAANLLRHVDPEKAAYYWKERQSLNEAWLNDD